MIEKKNKIEISENRNYLNRFISSIVEKILTFDCSLNAFSSDQIGQFNAKASAKYGMSLVWGEIFDAPNKKELYLSSETKIISSVIVENANSNSPIEISENCMILFFFNLNSSNKKYGEISLQPRFSRSSTKCLLIEFFLKNENKILASTTNKLGQGIFAQSPCRLATLFFKSSANLSACSSVNLDFAIMSSNIENLNLLTNCSTTFPKAVSNSSLNSSGILTFIFISAININKSTRYLKLSEIIKKE